MVFRLGKEYLCKLGPELGLVVQLGFKFRCENFRDVIIIFYPSLMEISQGDFYKVKVNPYWINYNLILYTLTQRNTAIIFRGLGILVSNGEKSKYYICIRMLHVSILSEPDLVCVCLILNKGLQMKLNFAGIWSSH